jgi:O-acetyl-ADP-ribose deacetylase
MKSMSIQSMEIEWPSVKRSMSIPAPKATLDRHEPRTDPFSVKLIEWIEERGMTNVECYRRANIDKKLFAKIYGNMHYQPKKNTALAFCVALRLDLEETQDLIGRAGYCLSDAIRFDLIVLDFIKRKHFDVIDINIALYDHGEPPLGSK